jgi:hypothetical protein
MVGEGEEEGEYHLLQRWFEHLLGVGGTPPFPSSQGTAMHNLDGPLYHLPFHACLRQNLPYPNRNQILEEP